MIPRPHRRRVPSPRRPAPSAMQRLEPRRLLSGLPAYPLLPLAGPPAGDALRASVNGEAFEVAAAQLYRSDGSTAGSAAVAPLVSSLFSWNGTLLFGSTPAPGGNTSLYKLEPGSSSPVEITDSGGVRLSPRADSFVPVGNQLFLAATAGQPTTNLYVTDGTSPGTHLLHTGTPIGRAGDVLVFSSTTPGPGSVTSVWRTDGTAAGTVLLKDNVAVSSVAGGQELGDAVLFSGPGGLWRSDGTAAGTALLKQAPTVSEWHRVGDAAYFLVAGSGSAGTLWKTDGTAAGTVSVGPALVGSRLPQRLTPSMVHIGNTLYYVVAESGRPWQLWATEGPGTSRRITNLGSSPTSDGVVPSLAAVDDKVLFAARVGTPAYDLYESTGAVGNATKVPGVIPGGNSVDFAPLNLLAVGGSLFWTQRPATGATQLWRYGVSAAALDAQGVLVVNGTDPAEGVAGNDAIGVVAAGDTVTATVNGVARSFPLASVRRITVNGLGGDDTLTADSVTSLPLTFNGGGGQDTLNVAGTAGDDVVTVTSAPNPGPGGSVHLSNVERLLLDTLDGADRITLLNLRTAATVHAGAGNDVLTLDDAARSEPEAYALSDSAFGRGSATLLNFDGAESVILNAGNGPNVISVTPAVATDITINGNDPTPPAAGADRLAINTAGVVGTRHEPGATTGAGRWTFDNRRAVNYTGIEQTDDGVPLTADVVDVAPDPRKAPVADSRIVFSEPVTGFDLADLRLIRAGGADNLLTAAQTLTSSDGGATWTLANLVGLTTPDGQYTLLLTAAGSGIMDSVGSPLAESASDAFAVDNVAPTVSIQPVSPDPRTEPVDHVRIVFSEPVAGFTAANLSLTRDGSANLLTAAQTLARVNDTTYELGNLSPVTRAAGAYALRLDGAAGAGVTDLAGNALAGAATEAWRTWAAVFDRHVFYNGSPGDGGDSAADARDDAVIAPDKRVLLPGQTSGLSNYTSYDRGINGVMLDMTGLPGALSAADFSFRVGNSADPSAWAAAPAPASITIRPGAGADGSDRVTLTWPDYSIRNKWLQVRLLSTAASGLPAPGDVFYVGNLGGETGNFPRGVGHKVDPGDFNGTRNQLFMTDLPLTSRWDHNRDGRINYADLAVVRRNLRAAPLTMFTAPPASGAAAAAAPASRSARRPATRTPLASGARASAAAVPNRGSDVRNFYELDGTIYFTADDGIHGVELWKTDGTEAGTVMVADINPGPGGSNPGRFDNVRGTLVFTADDGTHGEEPWRSDGTAAGTYLLEDVNPGNATSYPWVPNSYDGSRRELVVGGVLYFDANRDGEGFELWRTDGTPYGTYPVRDIRPGSDGSFPEGMTELNGRLVFSATMGDGDFARGIWTSNGTATGTTPVGGDTLGKPVFLTRSGNYVYYQFAGRQGENNILRRTDGSAAGTSAVKDLTGTLIWPPADVDGTLFLPVHSFIGVGAIELWKSDGTPEGTTRVGSGSPNVPSGAQQVTAYNGAAYFAAADTTSWQLWRSDGTTEGTHVVKVINPGTNGSFPESLRVIDGLLYFTATELGVGRQLWRTDGTEAGTVRLTSVPGGVGDQATFAKHGDYVYFGAGRDDTGWELWRTDGTPEGTTLFKDINQNP